MKMAKLRLGKLSELGNFSPSKSLSIAKFSKKCLYVIPNLPLPAFGRIYIIQYTPMLSTQPHSVILGAGQEVNKAKVIEPFAVRVGYFIGIYWFSSTLYWYWISIPEEDIVCRIDTYYLLLYALILTIISVTTAHSPQSVQLTQRSILIQISHSFQLIVLM